MNNLTVLTTSLKPCQSDRSLLPLILPSRQRIRQLYRLTMRLRYFPDLFAVLRYLPNFLAVMRCLATPNVPLITEVICACLTTEFHLAAKPQRDIAFSFAGHSYSKETLKTCTTDSSLLCQSKSTYVVSSD